MCLNVGTPLPSTVRKEEGGNRGRVEQSGQKGEGLRRKGAKGQAEAKRKEAGGGARIRDFFSAAVKLPLGSLQSKG